MPDVPTDEFIRQWFRGKPASNRCLIKGTSFIDLITMSGRMQGCAAVKFNRNVLVLEEFKYPNHNLGDVFRDVAREEGFELLLVKNFKLLRGCLRSGQTPSPREAKAFAMWLPALPARMRPFPSLNHPDKAVVRARITNAFEHNGDMTHIILREWESKAKDENSFTIHGYYPTPDEAMLDFMRIPKTEDYRLMEIGQ